MTYMRRIDDVLRSRLGTFRDAGIPEPVGGKRWLRFPCPFCGGDRAAISYEVGYFECYHADCRERLSATGDNSVVGRFRLQIRQAARNITADFPYLFRGERGFSEVRNYAAERVMVYAGSRIDGDADAGMLDEWEADVMGNPDQLDRYVLRALNCDLKDYAKSKLRQKRRETPAEPANMKASGYVSAGNLDGYPVLRMRYVEGLTQDQIAKELKVAVRTVKRRMADERKRYRDASNLAA